MGKSKSPSLPPAPVYQYDPIAQGVPKDLYGLGTRLTNFDFSGGLSPLEQTIQFDPEMTRLALESARGFLQPQFDDIRRQISNDAAANNQLQSSTFTDALARNAGNLQSQYQGIAAGAALEDRSRALQNRIGLFGTGLNTLQQAGGLAQNNQQQLNSFNIENYGNQVAATLAGQKQQSGGLFGALTGALGGGGLGAGLGALLAIPTGGLSIGAGALFGGLAGGVGGGLLGGLGPAGTGGGLLQSAAGLGGQYMGSRLNPISGMPIFAGQYAQNAPSNTDRLLKQLQGQGLTFGGVGL